MGSVILERYMTLEGLAYHSSEKPGRRHLGARADVGKWQGKVTLLYCQVNQYKQR